MNQELLQTQPWAKLVATNSDKQNIILHTDRNEHIIEGQLSIYRNQDNLTFIKNLSAPKLVIDNSELAMHQVKLLLGGESISLNPQDGTHPTVDYVFCFVNFHSDLKRGRDEMKESESLVKHLQINDLQNQLSCSVCKDNLEKSLTLTPCLHIFCSFCLLSQLKCSSKCPICQVEALSVERKVILLNMAHREIDHFPKLQRPHERKGLEELKFDGKIVSNAEGVYIGSVINGKRDGEGQFIWKDGTIYEGSWKNDRREGKGTVSYGGNKYDGDWVNDCYHGFGKFLWNNGQEYEGDFKDNVIHGHGRMKYDTGRVYKGDWKNGKEDGKGVVVFDNGDQYNGNWVNGVRSGFGNFIWSNGEEYQGNFQENSRHGYGEMRYSDGKVYKGDFKKGKREGKGVLVSRNDDKYEGFWRNDYFNGKGKFTWSNGQEYEGEFQDGFRHGSGIMKYEDGMIYKGEWKRDKREGQGALTLPNENKYVGKWVNDIFQTMDTLEYSTEETEANSFKKL